MNLMDQLMKGLIELTMQIKLEKQRNELMN